MPTDLCFFFLCVHVWVRLYVYVYNICTFTYEALVLSHIELCVEILSKPTWWLLLLLLYTED